MKKILLVAGLFWIASVINLFSQENMGIGTVTPDSSAILELDATDKGLLIPRVTLTGTNDATTISSPATGLLVFNTATVSDVTPGFYYNSGTPASPNWVKLSDVTGGTLAVEDGGTGSTGITGVLSGDGTSYTGNQGTTNALTYWTGTNTVNSIDDITWSSGDTELTIAGDLTANSITSDDLTANQIIYTPGTVPANPSNGTVYYNSSTNTLQVYSDGNWQTVGFDGSYWELGGNTGLAATDYFGSADDNDVIAIRNNNEYWRLSASGFDLEQSLRIKDASDTYYATIQTATQGDNYTLTLPADDGTANQVLTTDGSGVLSWTTPSGGGSGNWVLDVNTLKPASASATKIQWGLQGPSDGAIGSYATAFGQGTKAEASYSTAWGNGTQVTSAGLYGTAFGFSSVVSANYATAFGTSSTASGINSTAFGSNTVASGSNTTAIGNFTTSESAMEFTLGQYNTLAASPNPTVWTSSDRLLVAGIGTDDTDRKDALIIYKDGTHEIFGNTLIKSNDANANELRFYNSGNTNYSAFKAQAQATDITYTLPAADGAASTESIMVTDGAGNLSWSNSVAWNTVGNTGTNPSTDFLGTTDAQPIVFQTNSVERMRILSTGEVSINEANELRFYNAGNTEYTGFTSTADSTVNYNLPSKDGKENAVLSTDAEGGLFWQEMSSLGSNLRYNVLEVLNQATYDVPDTVSHILVERNGVSRINLMSGSEYAGKVIFIKRLSSGHDVEICPASGETIERIQSGKGINLRNEDDSMMLIYDGSSWWIMSAFVKNNSLQECNCP